ncbi:hypothetical protein LCGC14_1481850 [marine sediment metagenome]|uniref:dTDP-4-dehydrorhamnose 3,5-epimerase n=1 Tax=marine sediment metagenome TaxID=412755 RepID=A0A0F9JVA6_9ZZZZ
MKFIETKFKDMHVIEPQPFQDERGSFSRVFCEKEFKEIGLTKRIVQINYSATTKKGAIRGMHFQLPPAAEIKIVKCIRGSILDVGIDLRKNSSTFLQWYGEILSTDNMKMLIIPEGFAHGFQALEENIEMIYFVTEFYAPQYEGGVRYNDPKVKVEWPLEVTDISKKDIKWPYLDENFKGINTLG